MAELVALFAVSVGIAYVCYRLRLVPIVGFLIAGAIMGPSALGLVDDPDLVNDAAEIGVILLLFTIGVEFSLEKLARIGRFVLVGGGLQVGITLLLVSGGLWAFGVPLGVALFTGCLVALSSTAIVLTLLGDRGETDAPVGQLSLGILIFQDFGIILMVLLVPLMAGQGGAPLDAILALGRAVLLIALTLVLARKVIPWVLEKVAHTRRSELFVLTVVAICFGTAWITSLFEVSLALGAFLAGLVVSESKYSAHALSEILPLRTIFNALFFVSVGMLLDLSFLVQNLPLVLGVAVIVLLLKLVVTTASVLALGFPLRIAAAVGLALAQIGEFSFVLERSAAELGMTPAGLGETGAQTFIAVTVLLMIATPPLLALGPKLGRWLEKTPLTRLARRQEPPADTSLDHLEDHVIIVGYGPVGERLAQVLHKTELPHIVLELNPFNVERAQADGLHVLYGDASRTHLLEHAGIHKAKLCVVAISDEAAAMRVVGLARDLNPTLQVVVRTRYLSEAENFEAAGADIVVPEALETSIRIFSHVLGAYLIPQQEIQHHINELRSGDYQYLRSSIHEAHLMVLQGLDEEGLHTRAIAVRPGAPAAGQTLKELALRQHYNLTVLAVRRGRQTIGNPAGNFEIEPGDRLIVVGLADQFAGSAHLFRSPSAA